MRENMWNQVSATEKAASCPGPHSQRLPYGRSDNFFGEGSGVPQWECWNRQCWVVGRWNANLLVGKPWFRNPLNRSHHHHQAFCHSECCQPCFQPCFQLWAWSPYHWRRRVGPSKCLATDRSRESSVEGAPKSFESPPEVRNQLQTLEPIRRTHLAAHLEIRPESHYHHYLLCLIHLRSHSERVYVIHVVHHLPHPLRSVQRHWQRLLWDPPVR